MIKKQTKKNIVIIVLFSIGNKQQQIEKINKVLVFNKEFFNFFFSLKSAAVEKFQPAGEQNNETRKLTVVSG